MRILILFVFGLLSNLSCSDRDSLEDCSINLEPDDVYLYPIRPGMEEWAQLESGDAQFEATQVPKNKARKMSTDGLIKTCLTYPLYFDLPFVNSYPRTMNGFKDRFNGLKELVRRRNSGCKMLSRYQKVNFHELINISDHLVLSVLVCDFAMLDNMNLELQKLLVSEALSNHEIQFNYPEHYSFIGAIALEIWVCARVMLYNEYKPFLEDMKNSVILTEFVETGQIRYGETYEGFAVQSILTHSSNFITN
jgi:hypothetical protein